MSPPSAPALLARLIDCLADAEWQVAGQIVADITVDGLSSPQADGSILVALEALTIAE